MTSLWRIIKTGCQAFWRHKWVSSATIGVMAVALFLIGAVLLISSIGSWTLNAIEQKVEVSAFFESTAEQEQILSVKQDLEARQDVSQVTYISRTDALNRFKELHKNDPDILAGLEAVGENPLPASLNVKAKSPQDFEKIAEFLRQDQYQELIDTVNFQENRLIIERLSTLTDSMRRAGLGAGIVLVIIAILITFNTIRLTIYNARDEISVMRLVGSGNWFIRGPFVIEGILYGLVAALITTIIFYVGLAALAPKINPWFAGLNPTGDTFQIFQFFQGNLLEFFLTLTAIGVFTGVISSFIAIRRFLKI